MKSAFALAAALSAVCFPVDAITTWTDWTSRTRRQRPSDRLQPVVGTRTCQAEPAAKRSSGAPRSSLEASADLQWTLNADASSAHAWLFITRQRSFAVATPMNGAHQAEASEHHRVSLRLGNGCRKVDNNARSVNVAQTVPINRDSAVGDDDPAGIKSRHGCLGVNRYTGNSESAWRCQIKYQTVERCCTPCRLRQAGVQQKTQGGVTEVDRDERHVLDIRNRLDARANHKGRRRHGCQGVWRVDCRHPVRAGERLSLQGCVHRTAG
jgi:hypothetical protein